MATIDISTIGNTRFVGTPVTVRVTAGAPANATFHRVRLNVAIPSGSASATQFEFSTPVENGQQVLFDIASAFMAFIDSHEYQATVLNQYPTLSADLTACDDYMVDGEEHTGAFPSGTTTVSGYYAGALTDMERITETMPSRYSRKPVSSPEICFTGWQHLHPGLLVDGITPQPPSVTSVTVPGGFAAGNNIYGIPAPRDGYELRFINSLGVHENVFIRGFPSSEVSYQTEQYVVARQETLTQFSRGIAIKSGNHERYKMQAGPLDREWQSWYIHEVLMARWAWLRVGTHYIPCHILPEDTVSAIDLTKSEALTVSFTVELDIEGSPSA